MPRKQIAFDLDTKVLRKTYPKKSWKSAYNDIKRYMKKSDFSWEQGSVYVSNRVIDKSTMFIILTDLTEKYPWINICMRDCKQTNITTDSNVNHFFDKDIVIKKSNNYIKRFVAWIKELFE